VSGPALCDACGAGSKLKRGLPAKGGDAYILFGQKYEFLLEHLSHNVVEMKGNNQGCTLCETVCRFEADKSEMGIIVFGKSKIVCVEAWEAPGLSRYIDTAVRREEGRVVFCQAQR